jgi:hypothetical protein
MQQLTDRQLWWMRLLAIPAEDCYVRAYHRTYDGDPRKQAQWRYSIFQRHMAYRRLELDGDIGQEYSAHEETTLEAAQRLWQSRGRHAHIRRIARQP